MGYSVTPWLVFSGFSSHLHKSFLQSQTSARAIHLDVASGYFFALGVSFVPIQMGWLHHQTPCFTAYSLPLDHYTDPVFCWCRWWHPNVQGRHFPDGKWNLRHLILRLSYKPKQEMFVFYLCELGHRSSFSKACAGVWERLIWLENTKCK